MEWKFCKALKKGTLSKIEKMYDIQLPEVYKKFIEQYNAGALVNGYYICTDGKKIPYSSNLNLMIESKFNAMILFEIIDDGCKKIFPFGNVGNGDYFCFDLQTEKVVLYKHELGEKIILEECFNNFLSKLAEDI